MEKINEITYDRIADAIFDSLNAVEISENVMQNKDFTDALECFCETYVEPIEKMSYDTGEKMYDDLISLIFDFARRSFKIGFKSAFVCCTDDKIEKESVICADAEVM